jgi:hypothetical protein
MQRKVFKDKSAHTKAMDTTILATLTSVAVAGERCPTDAVMGEPHGWSGSQVQRAMYRLIDAQRIVCEVRGGRRVVTIPNLGISTASYFPAVKDKPAQSDRVKLSLASIPDKAARAMTALRRTGVVCFAERVSETSTRVTGWFKVGSNYISLEQLLALPGAKETK